MVRKFTADRKPSHAAEWDEPSHDPAEVKAASIENRPRASKGL
ncbi:MAG: hypothetical protein ABL881_02815 [Novosphingobium sp.]